MSVLLAILAAGTVANADIRPMLREQGFYGPLNGQEQIAYAGHIRQGQSEYQIYVYRGVSRPASVDHGVNRIVVILNGSIFLGQYAIGLPTECQVRGRRVICHTEGPQCPGVIKFTTRGPPAETWFGCEVLHFELGNRVKPGTSASSRRDNHLLT